jgi:Flp pilus assembly pilin Flp
MRVLLSLFLQDDRAQGLVEYSIIVAFVAIGLIAVLVLLRTATGNVFNESRNELDQAGIGGY